METPLELRAAADRDREAIWGVHTRAIRETCGLVYSPRQIEAWVALLSPASYTQVIAERVVVVAVGKEGVCGFGQLNPSSGEVDAVYVLPAHQGRGTGAALLAYLERQANALGIRQIHLSATLNAVRFYAKSGFVNKGPVVHRLPSGVELQCTRMAKELA